MSIKSTHNTLHTCNNFTAKYQSNTMAIRHKSSYNIIITFNESEFDDFIKLTQHLKQLKYIDDPINK